VIRTLLIIPVVIAVTVGVGYGACIWMHRDPHIREMLLAAGACLMASLLAMAPMILTRGAAQSSVAQAGLVATMLHLFGSTVLIGGPTVLFKSLQLDAALLYWALPLYWLSLIMLVIAVVQAIKSAPVATTPK
jgi:hypothetical protein